MSHGQGCDSAFGRVMNGAAFLASRGQERPPDSTSVSQKRQIANVFVRYLSSGHLFEARMTVLALCLNEWLLELCLQSL